MFIPCQFVGLDTIIKKCRLCQVASRRRYYRAIQHFVRARAWQDLKSTGLQSRHVLCHDVIYESLDTQCFTFVL